MKKAALRGAVLAHPREPMATASSNLDPASGSPIQAYLEQLHAKLVDLRSGEVATYIPPLSKADPEWFAICLATTDGNVYEVGDSSIPFTIQSISKPFVYGLALQDHELDGVARKIGVEPTGDA